MKSQNKFNFISTETKPFTLIGSFNAKWYLCAHAQLVFFSQSNSRVYQNGRYCRATSNLPIKNARTWNQQESEPTLKTKNNVIKFYKIFISILFFGKDKVSK